MDTKEKKPSRRREKPASRPRKAPAGQKRPGRPAAQSRTAVKPGRRVRPPREDIPEVIYTMPKPFRKGSFLLKLVSVAAVAVAAVLALSLFLRVDTVRVSGMDKYTPWMIREASGVEEGDSLLGVNRAKLAGRITSKLPYVDQVKISISLPGTVNIEVTELKVSYALESDGGTWWLVTAQGRVVEQIDPEQAGSYPRILGVKAEGPVPGQMIQQAEQAKPDAQEPEQTQEPSEEDQPTDPEQTTEPEQTAAPAATGADPMGTALELAQLAEENEVFGRLTVIDVTDLLDLQLSCGDRLRIRLGGTERLEYKMGYLAQALRQLPGNEAGELDISFALSEEAIFTPAE